VDPAGRRLTWIDVFTRTPLTGNGLAVVHDADALDAAAMQRIARETNQSETTFVQAATRAGADYRNRIFTVAEELPFAGHPSLGTAVAVAHARGLSTARFVQETVAGLQPVEVGLDGRAAHASMLQEPAELRPAVAAAPVLAALGLEPEDAHPELPVQPVSTGIFHLLVPVRDAGVLDRARPDAARLQLVRAGTQTLAVYPFAPPTGGSASARAFFIAHGQAVEDPATGSAAGPVCAYLHRHTGATAVAIDQGVAMGRPSRLDATIDGDRVRVAGDCVIVLEGVLHA
jgi:trans-2,3-dihydro-3-hydroxyanthranilate isomerase